MHGGLARPTLRCLYEDLAADVTDPHLRRALLARQPLPADMPLHSLPHPLVTTVRDHFAAGPPPPTERIEAVRDRAWFRDRHGQWRAAVWIDGDQPWIGFAGLRRQGDVDDFYAKFASRCSVGSTTDSTQLLPTDADHNRLRLEEAVAAHSKRERDRKIAIISGLIDAAATPGKVCRVELTGPTGTADATLQVEIDPGDPGELYLSVEILDFANADYYDVLQETLEAVPGVAPDEWDNVPPHGIHSVPLWYVLVSSDWVRRFVNAAEAAGLEDFCDDSDLADGADHNAHIVPAKSLMVGIVDGSLVRAACGRRFVPNRNPDRYPVCDACVRSVAILKAAERRVAED